MHTPRTTACCQNWLFLTAFGGAFGLESLLLPGCWGVATVLLRCYYGITPMCTAQLTDIEALAEANFFFLLPSAKLRNHLYHSMLRRMAIFDHFQSRAGRTVELLAISRPNPAGLGCPVAPPKPRKRASSGRTADSLSQPGRALNTVRQAHGTPGSF